MVPITRRPRRSALYMPGANARALEKARSLDADCVILDLEDAVLPDAKPDARDAVCAALQDGFGSSETIIRINALSTPWGDDDLDAVLSADPDAILVPKIDSADDIATLHDRMTDCAPCGSIPALWVMIETPLAVLNLASIAAMAKTTNLAGFVMGWNDLAKDMRAIATADRAAFQPFMAMAVAAARANGLIVLDGVFNDIGNDAALAAECEQARQFGFDGKTLIHPSQLEAANRIFAPDAEALAQARAVIAAFDDPANQGKGVLKVNGKMTELLHRDSARDLVAMADMIAARSAPQTA